jgi:hypothetical protein
VLNTFVTHKKDVNIAKAQEDFVAELKKLNCTSSMIPGGSTGYV